MALIALAATVAVVLALGGTSNADEARARRTRVAQVARAGDAVYGEGKRLWRGDGGERVISTAVWSRARDAVAFATRAPSGAVTLVVVLVGGQTHGHTMRWPIPEKARPDRGAPSVTWLGKQRVSFGRSELRPAVVASWRVR